MWINGRKTVKTVLFSPLNKGINASAYGLGLTFRIMSRIDKHIDKLAIHFALIV